MTDATTWPKILTLHQKHGDESYLIENFNELDRVARAIVTDRVRYGWICEADAPEDYFSEEERALMALTEDQIRSLPDVLRQTTADRRASLLSRFEKVKARSAADGRDFVNAQAIAADPSVSSLYEVPSSNDPGTSIARSRAWDILLSRRREEYEGFELADLPGPYPSD